jgi:Skp family chaperone for outer membrane proteins
MKLRMCAAATAILVAGLVVSNVYAASDRDPMAKKAAAKKKASSCCSDVQDQIQALRQEMQGQIDALKSDLSAKDAELQQAKQAAADAQAAAAKAEADATAQQQAIGENSTAVATLQSTVKDLGNNQASLTDTLTTENTNIKKMVNEPDAIHFKGVTLSPTGSFLAAETVWRNAAIGSDINTPFTSVPLDHSEAAQLSEFFGSGRQSRAALRVTGKLPNVTLTGYYEADWLGTGTSSNNNQSNSYVLRQRQLWGDAKTTGGWDFSGGQGWSLATETTQGLTRGTEILPSTIDAAYETGFVWTRQESFRVTKDFGKTLFIGASAENAETLNPGGNNLPINELIGSAGTNGGLYNAAGTAISGAALANYTFNFAPDIIVKAAVEPGWGHWEVFGIDRTFRDRIYPNLACSTAGTPAVTTCTAIITSEPGTAGAYNDKESGFGIGGGFRGSLVGTNKVVVGLKGLWGQGMGRYGDSTIADVTIRPSGLLSPIHGFSALSTIEVNPTPRLTAYFNYGGDELDRDYVLNGTTQVGYGNRSQNMSGCEVEENPGNGGVNQSAAPIAPSNCGGSIKDVQEFTGGYWFNFIAGPKGRLRQGFQYSWVRRDLWSGATSAANPGAGANGTDNMVFTSLRYYLP